MHKKSTEIACNYLKRLIEKAEETCPITHYFSLTKPTLPMQDLISSRVYGTIAERDEAEFRALIRSAIEREALRGAEGNRVSCEASFL